MSVIRSHTAASSSTTSARAFASERAPAARGRGGPASSPPGAAGSRIVTAAPRPASDSIVRVPPCRWITARAGGRPRPGPGTPLVESPGSNTSPSSSGGKAAALVLDPINRRAPRQAQRDREDPNAPGPRRSRRARAAATAGGAARPDAGSRRCGTRTAPPPPRQGEVVRRAGSGPVGGAGHELGAHRLVVRAALVRDAGPSREVDARVGGGHEGGGVGAPREAPGSADTVMVTSRRSAGELTTTPPAAAADAPPATGAAMTNTVLKTMELVPAPRGPGTARALRAQPRRTMTPCFGAARRPCARLARRC